MISRLPFVNIELLGCPALRRVPTSTPCGKQARRAAFHARERQNRSAPPQRDHYWRPALKRLKIRQRRAYCTRHTYCTAALMGGVNPAYIAAQAGHSTKMLLCTYSRWIPGADGGSERARLAALSEGVTSPALPRKENRPA